MSTLAKARMLIPYFVGVSVFSALVAVSAFFVSAPKWFMWLSVLPGIISIVVCQFLLVGEWAGRGRRNMLRWMLGGVPIWARIIWFGTVLATVVAFFDAAATVYPWVVMGLAYAVTATMVAWATLREGPLIPKELEETTSPY